jgi:hypothetical protein
MVRIYYIIDVTIKEFKMKNIMIAIIALIIIVTECVGCQIAFNNFKETINTMYGAENVILTMFYCFVFMIDVVVLKIKEGI